MRRTAIAALGLITACAGKPVPAVHAPAAEPARHAAPEANPLFAYVPADTPYLLASFRPTPPEYVDELFSLYRPAIQHELAKSGPGSDVLRAVAVELGAFDMAHLETIGLSSRLRFALYATGLNPTVRLEIADGDRVYAFILRVAKRLKLEVPAPTVRGEHRYWTATDKKDALIFSLEKHEVVFAVVPTAELAVYLPRVLGDQRPAHTLTTAMLQAIAKRDGFNGSSVGFIEPPQMLAALLPVLGDRRPPPACVEEIGRIVNLVPRITFGTSDVTSKHLGYGVVAELAPRAQAALAGLAAPVPGLQRLLSRPPVIGLAGAIELTHARALAPHLASGLRALGGACSVAGFNTAADGLDHAAGLPLPPFLAGAIGGVGAIEGITMVDGRPTKIDGFSILSIGNAEQMFAMAAKLAPGLAYTADGKAQVLPPFALVPGHLAAKGSVMTIATGDNSAALAEQLLADPPEPTPLALVELDYSRLGDLVGENAPSFVKMRELFPSLGVAMLQAGVDARGLYIWLSLGLN